MGGATYSAVPVVGMCRGVTEAEETVASSASRYFNSAMQYSEDDYHVVC